MLQQWWSINVHVKLVSSLKGRQCSWNVVIQTKMMISFGVTLGLALNTFIFADVLIGNISLRGA